MLPVAINFVPTGAVPRRSDHPGVPLQPDEIVQAVSEVLPLGVSIVHLHARDKHGAPTGDPAVFQEIIAGVRGVSRELIVCVSLSGRGGTPLEERAAVLGLAGEEKPDMGSLTTASMNFAREASINAPETVRELARRMLAAGVMPEIEAFDLGMLNVARYLAERGLLKPPFYANVILGNLAGLQATPAHAAAAIAAIGDLPGDTTWAFGGIGAHQLTANSLAFASGGSVRTGLEDNLFWDAARSRHATNYELVERAAELARLNGRPVATPTEVRKLLGLLPGNGEYGRNPTPLGNA